MQNLWPEDIAHISVRPPVAILKDQAALLAERTHNIAVAEVRSVNPKALTSLFNKTINAIKSDAFIYEFYIVGPTLNGYRHKLFTTSNGIDLYPVTFYFEDESSFQCLSEPALIDYLRTIFSSESTRSVVRAIVGQSGVFGDPPE